MSGLLSPSQAARLLDLHPNSVRRLAAEGKLRSQRVGWARVFELQHVQELVEERRRRGRGPGANRRTGARD
jgi:excisionase family DNA binding protein